MMKQALALSMVAGVLGNSYGYDGYKAPSYDTYKAPSYDSYKADSYNTYGYDDAYKAPSYDSYSKGYDTYSKDYDSYNKGYGSYNKGYGTTYNKGYDTTYNKGYNSYNKGYNNKGYNSYNKGYDSHANYGVSTYKPSSYRTQPRSRYTQGYKSNYGSNYNQYGSNYARNHGSRYTQGYKSNYGSNYNQGYKSGYGSNYGSHYNQGYKAADYVDAGYDNYGNGGVSHYKGMSGPEQAKNAYGRHPGHGRYERIDKGYCASEGCFPVTSPEECSHAAAELYLVDTTVAEAKRLDTPAGCYFRPDFQTLWFNYYSGDAAQPNRQNLCYCPNDVGDVGYEPNAFNVGGESATIED